MLWQVLATELQTESLLNKNINYSLSDHVKKLLLWPTTSINIDCLRSSYNGHFNNTCFSFSKLSQLIHNLSFNSFLSYRPVYIFNGATPHLN
jgi:hypothetical protein